MPYDPDLLDLMWIDEEQHYEVWYDGVLIGTAKDEEEAHYVAVNYGVGNV